MSTVSIPTQFNYDRTFAKDIAEGLERTPKKLSSKYFYDAKGDKLFQDIMNMPEYYLTNCEYDIFTTQKENILKELGKEHFSLIELGAGDGTKTKVLLAHFLAQNADFQYAPIDISQNALDLLEADLENLYPKLNVSTLQGDYFEVLESLNAPSYGRKVVLFLGSNIGNFLPEDAERFLMALGETLDKGDMLLLGVDLKKDPQLIWDAYNDKAGITADFNLNLLERMNRELGADFVLKNFKHWETYNPLTGATKSYIVSKKKQKVHIEALNKIYYFAEWEAIDVELSQKYSVPELEDLAKQTGFEVVKHFFDKKQYFVDSLWRK